jgi:hypothetical protein
VRFPRDRLLGDELRLRARLLDERALVPELRELFDPEALLRPERLDPLLERCALEAVRCEVCRVRCWPF